MPIHESGSTAKYGLDGASPTMAVADFSIDDRPGSRIRQDT